jgi:hypothetical protein
MHASIDTTIKAGNQAPDWILLIHQIPPKPDYFRVKVRRKLSKIGAIALKNSVYVLPNTDDAMEDFQWLRRVIAEEGGEATVCTAGFVEGINDREVKTMFREQSDAEYSDILESARAVSEDPTESELRKLKRQLTMATARDFFGASGADAATLAIDRIAETLPGQSLVKKSTADGDTEIAPHAATWVTRTGVYVDRIASAWLILRFIDEGATFKFVPAKGYHRQPGEYRFDMFEGEFTHEGDECTFEVLRNRFVRGDTAIDVIAEIVHDIDYKEEKFRREETPGIASVLRGLALAHSSDEARIDAGKALLDGLYSALQKENSR